jgi:hypothetical protein
LAVTDSEQKITDFCEREVNWVHATLLNFENELDVRINVQTSELEDQNKELFKFVFPDGKVAGNIVQVSPTFYEQFFHTKVFCTAFMCFMGPFK